MQILLKQHKSWLAETTKFIATYGESAPTDCDLEGTTSKYESHNLRKAERALEEKLRALVADLEALLTPLLGAGSKAFNLLQALLGVNTPNGTGVLKDAQPSLMLLVDCALQSLPWEALQLPALFNGRVCRDFSLHMMNHRMQTLAPAGAAGVGAGATAPSTATVGGTATASVTASGLKYIVDPLREDEYPGTRMPGLERLSITQAVNNLILGTTPAGPHSKLFIFFASLICCGVFISISERMYDVLFHCRFLFYTFDSLCKLWFVLFIFFYFNSRWSKHADSCTNPFPSGWLAEVGSRPQSERHRVSARFYRCCGRRHPRLRQDSNWGSTRCCWGTCRCACSRRCCRRGANACRQCLSTGLRAGSSRRLSAACGDRQHGFASVGALPVP